MLSLVKLVKPEILKLTIERGKGTVAMSLFLLAVKKMAIECVHVTSANSQIQNQRATKGFILIRHKK